MRYGVPVFLLGALLAGGHSIGVVVQKNPNDTTTLDGQVLPLIEILKARGLQVDPAPIASQVALKCESGTIWPLLLDDGSRALFTDARLRNRPARLFVRRDPEIPYLQVLSFLVREAGAYRNPEYWCEVCSISWRYDPELCPCCQGPMELRYKPSSP